LQDNASDKKPAWHRLVNGHSAGIGKGLRYRMLDRSKPEPRGLRAKL
jgi:hypothetical protein